MAEITWLVPYGLALRESLLFLLNIVKTLVGDLTVADSSDCR
jgi:hypothetical protein